MAEKDLFYIFNPQTNQKLLLELARDSAANDVILVIKLFTYRCKSLLFILVQDSCPRRKGGIWGML